MRPVQRDSRRIPGPSIFYKGPGAVIDFASADADAEPLARLWREEVGRMIEAVGWRPGALVTKTSPGGGTLFMSAPLDCLYSATEVNEWAFEAAVKRLAGEPAPPLEAGAAHLKERIAAEAKPALLRISQDALSHNVTFTTDFKATSVGSGSGVLVQTTDHLDPAAIDWSRVRDVPIVLITGSNGKTTTTRLLASIVRHWKKVPGLSSTDNLVVGTEVIEKGDWSGPMGARAILRDPRVEVALLETARGGILRRGLAVTHADAAVVTNVAEDHFGEWGVHDLFGIAHAKLVVGHVAGRLVLNAEDPVLVAHAKAMKQAGIIAADVGYFALDPRNPVLVEHMNAGSTAAFFDGSDLFFVYRRRATRVVHAADIPVTLGGVARFNIANALGAMLVAAAIGIPKDVIAEGLRRFKGTPLENPGRGHLYNFGGARVLVDFAHNPHGMRALIETVKAMPAKRRIVVLGQAGDRDDESIRSLARETWSWKPDRVILKEMEIYLRGRQPGEATGLIRDEFLKLGAAESVFGHADSELAAVKMALAEAGPGDLVLLPTHAERQAVIDLMHLLERKRWKAGSSLPTLPAGGA